MNRQKHQRRGPGHAPRMKFGGLVEVGAFPSPCTAVNHPVALHRLVGEMEHLVGDGKAVNPEREEGEDETVVDGMLQGLASNIVDVEWEDGENQEVEDAKDVVGKRVVAVPR